MDDLADPAAAPRALQRLRQGGAHTPRGSPRDWGRAGAAYIGNVLQPGGEAGDAWGRYVVDLEGVGTDSWRRMFAEDEED